MMTDEYIARQLAAELSQAGERDWPRFLALACEVRKRLERLFPRETGPDREDGADFRPRERTRARMPSS